MIDLTAHFSIIVNWMFRILCVEDTFDLRLRAMFKLCSFLVLNFSIVSSQYPAFNYAPAGMGPSAIFGQQSSIQPSSPVNIREKTEFTQMANGEQIYREDRFSQYPNGRESEVIVEKQFSPRNMMSLGSRGNYYHRDVPGTYGTYGGFTK